uniref:Putative pyrimidine-nucleoside phosphorylase n=1 Tax=Sphaerisporangium sp. SANK 60911 TaxID=1354075 RepID=V5YRJ2_9ACTN|nr:putative pyrimidine-nucleoside phosphorylase [Sphaerisporangium sp. SANK 60911]
MGGTEVSGDREASARMIAAITRKRSGAALEASVIERLVGDVVAGRVPDYQTAAWLATVACQGLDSAETLALTRAYIAGGGHLDLRGRDRPVVDKHSTGGVGDKVTLVVVPAVAACGPLVAKMSGKGLGHAGGTLDKLASIAGLRLDLGAGEIPLVLDGVGMVITGQSEDLAPGDKATYGLRDVTGTVDSIPLIAASIMSKKLAVRTDALILDVKTGAGALMPDRADATRLAALMLEIGRAHGLRCRAVLSDMSRPLGYAVGNALEVKEALRVLAGEYVPRLSELCVTLSTLLLCAAEPDLDEESAGRRVRAVLESGAACERFARWVGAQGGDAGLVEHPERLPSAPLRHRVLAEDGGHVRSIEPRAIGMAALRLGAGRLTQHDTIDPSAGILLHRQVGDAVRPGDPLAELHHGGHGDLRPAIALVREAFTIGSEAPDTPPVVQQIW